MICIFLCGIFLTNSNGQSAEMQKAHKLRDEGKFFKAVVAYEYVVFKYPHSEESLESRYNKGLCYRYLLQYEKALQELQSIRLFNIDPTLRNMVLYEKALNHFMLQEANEAMWELNKIKAPDPALLSDKIIPLKILIYNQQRNFTNSNKELVSYLLAEVNDGATLMKLGGVIQELYQDKNLPRQYKEITARHWSRFVPGAGQVYAGKVGEGLISFLINASLLSFGIYELWNAYYFTGYMVGFGVMYKTYTGGMSRAANLSKAKTHNDMIDYNNQTIEIIKEIQRFPAKSIE